MQQAVGGSLLQFSFVWNELLLALFADEIKFEWG